MLCTYTFPTLYRRPSNIQNRFTFNNNQFVGHLHAATDIPAGNEVLVGYTEPATDRETRRDILKKRYGFWCDCPQCSLSNEEIKVSDENRKFVCAILDKQEVSHGIALPYERLQKALDLSLEEKLPIHHAYIQAHGVSNLYVQDDPELKKKAVECLRGGYRECVMLEGANGAMVEMLERTARRMEVDLSEEESHNAA